ncbi:MAG TPA: hypothetical protein GXX51_01390 [Firmicutes bacterium]|nr:hypothetical protein [Bacillota bacterium]
MEASTRGRGGERLTGRLGNERSLEEREVEGKGNLRNEGNLHDERNPRNEKNVRNKRLA